MRPETIAVSELEARLDRLEEAGAALRAIPLHERIATIDRVATRWREPRSPWRQRALDALLRTTGYAPDAIGHALDHLWGAMAAPELAAIAARELGPEAGAPERLAFHSLAGNVPGVGVFGIVAALLAGVPSVVKTARREPALPALVAASLAAEDHRLGDALAVVHWPGGSDAHAVVVRARSSVVLAYGRDDTLDRLAAHTSSRLLRFAPRLSVALVCRGAGDATAAVVAARQVSLFDQQGCLSPQYLVLEETTADATTAFVDALTAALRRLAVELPRAPLTLDEAAQAWRFLEHERWRAQEGAVVRVLGDATFAVVCDRSGAPATSPMNRHLIVLPVATLAEARQLLAHLDHTIEAVGVAAPAERLADAAAFAATLGAHRLCPLDRMQAPPFAWRQSGHPRLGSFLVPPAPGAGTARAYDASPPHPSKCEYDDAVAAAPFLAS